MPKPTTRTPEAIDRDISEAEKVRDAAYAAAQRRGKRLPVAWNSELGMRADPEPAVLTHRAWQAAWESEKAVLTLQHERAVLNQRVHAEAPPPDAAILDDLSRRLAEATEAMKSLRGELFRERGRHEDHQRRGVNLSQKIVEYEGLLAGAVREIRKQADLADEAARVAAGRAALASAESGG